MENKGYNSLELFFVSEFEKKLQDKGVDTVCFMGYQYDISDIRVGAEFYFSYLFYGIKARIGNRTKEDCLKDVLADHSDISPLDRFQVVQKYKYFDVNVLDPVSNNFITAKERRYCVKVKNLVNNKTYILSEEELDQAHFFCWVTLGKI